MPKKRRSPRRHTVHTKNSRYNVSQYPRGVTLQDVKNTHSQRSVHAQRIDEALKSKVGSHEDWMRDPSRHDVEGVDLFRFKVKTIPLTRRRKMFTEFSEKSAKKMERRLKPHEGKVMLLSGGGWGGGTNYVVLEKVTAKPATYYAHGSINEPYHPKDIYNVNVRVKAVFKRRGIFGSDGRFEPHIGSWRLNKIIPSVSESQFKRMMK